MDVIRQVNMGRPRASNAVRDFAALFAKSVTVPSSARYDWVARTGETSIFVLLSRLSPKVLSTFSMFEIRFLISDRTQIVRSSGNERNNR